MLFLENVGGYFFTWAKHLLGSSRGDISTFFYLHENPSNYPMKCFARLKKITTHIFEKCVAFIVK